MAWHKGNGALLRAEIDREFAGCQDGPDGEEQLFLAAMTERGEHAGRARQRARARGHQPRQQSRALRPDVAAELVRRVRSRELTVREAAVQYGCSWRTAARLAANGGYAQDPRSRLWEPQGAA